VGVQVIHLVVDFETEDVIGEDVPPSWNLAPTDPVRIVVKRCSTDRGADAPPVRRLRTARWGLVPSWAKDRKGGAKLINANRPAAGYDEWLPTADADGKTFKQPYYIHGDQMLSFVGLYELWPDPDKGTDDPGPVAVVGRDHHPPTPPGWPG
jgi:putative SOS response-associated peptidase YedK